MDRNGAFGSHIANQMLRQYSEIGITTDDIVVPSDLGKVTNWGQAEYLLFWSHVITGLDPKEAEVVTSCLSEYGLMNAPGFYDASLPREQRWDTYKALIDGYVGALETNNLGKGHNDRRTPCNIQASVLILDATQSLGVNAERYLCHKLGFGEYIVEISQPSQALQQELLVLEDIGANSLLLGEKPNIYGTQNTKRYWELREAGFRFRKSGF